jgi:thiol-disulfide isomerase/thioredoxin
MNRLIILLILIAAVLFTAGCTEKVDNSTTDAQEIQVSVVENLTDLEQINTSVQKGPVLVKVGAEWCGPCQQMKPILSDLAAEYTGKATIMSADIDVSPNLQFISQRLIFRIPLWSLDLKTESTFTCRRTEALLQTGSRQEFWDFKTVRCMKNVWTGQFFTMKT